MKTAKRLNGEERRQRSDAVVDDARLVKLTIADYGEPQRIHFQRLTGRERKVSSRLILGESPVLAVKLEQQG